MQIFYDNGFYKIAKITGGQDNYLGLRFSSAPSEINITPLALSINDVVRVDGQAVLEQVRRGLDYMNRELGQSYYRTSA